jgi:hypothetical protein
MLIVLLVFPTLQITSVANQESGAKFPIPEQLRGVPGVSEFWWTGVQEKISAGILPDAPDWYEYGEHKSAYYGLSVGTAGDVNGDGYADVIIGSPNFSGGQTSEGKVYVYHGSNTGLATTPNWTMEGDKYSVDFGYSVGTAGDVNDDGYADIIIGARRYYDKSEELYEGTAFVFHGSEMGLSDTPNWSAQGNVANAWFGVSVGTAGDVNGDGYSDVIVGAAMPLLPVCLNKAFVYYGSELGLSVTADWIGENAQAESCFGNSVGTAGDVNGDGYSDVIVGAPWYDNGQSDEGAAFVYFGSDSGLSATPNWSAEGDQVEAYFGISVGTAGDVNGDTYSDVIVGASSYDNGQEDEGRAYVYHGSGTGLSTTPDWSAEGDQEYAYYGISVGTAGNVNNDKYSEVLVGAYWYDNPNNSEGRAYLYAGSAGGLSTSADWINESNQSFAYYGYSLGTAGDVNGNGFSDVIVGAYHYYYDEDDQGRVYVYYDLEGYRSYLPLVVR